MGPLPAFPRGAPGRALAAALLGTLVLLLVHVREYAFLTDDAFISFRYARHLAAGQGLVFNPGEAPVEGYTNFLWVLLLAPFEALGVPAARAATWLSVACTVVLWALVVRFALRAVPNRTGSEWGRLFAAVPPLLLAATRSFAVWATSGLETRLFELLIFAGALRVLAELERAGESPPPARPAAGLAPWGAVLLALAALTRPEGLLVGGCVLAAGALVAPRAEQRPWALRSLAVFAALVGAHLAFRLVYYGDWVPNTYHAKVGGRLRWGTGGLYLAAFVLEYAAYLWGPLLVAGVLAFRARGSLAVPVVFAAAVLPHALAVTAIGGDHFEYRPLDLYLPFLFVLVGCGAAHLARGRGATLAVGAYLAVLLVGLVELPWRAHVEFPERYEAGFPGLAGSEEARSGRFLAPERSPVYRWPGLRAIASAHRRLVYENTARFDAVRQEEHALFLALASAEAERLRGALERGVLPPDASIAVDCVGVIPYVTDLRVLDRLGLNERRVARGAFTGELSGHAKRARPELATELAIDLWAVDNVRLLFERDDPLLLETLLLQHEYGQEVWFADAGEGLVLLAWLPRGLESARGRFPRLSFHSTRDLAAIRAATEGERG